MKKMKILLMLGIVLTSVCFFCCFLGFIYNAFTSRGKALDYAEQLLDEQPEYAVEIIGTITSISNDAVIFLLSMFAIVVTVWVALNVYNMVNKDEVNELYDRLNAILCDSRTLYKDLEEKSRFEFEMAFHGTYLEYTGTDYILLHLKEVTEKQDSEIVEIMEKLEKLYAIAMIEYYNDSANNPAGLYEVALETALNAMECIEKTGNPYLLGYVYLRLANLYYFESNTKDAETLWKTIDYCQKTHQAWFPNARKETLQLNYTNEELYSLVDLYNLIAITSSYIYNHSKDNSKEKLKAKELMGEYYILLNDTIEETNLNKVFPKRLELYYRNIGCFYDYAYYSGEKNIISEKAIMYYKKAIQYNPQRDLLYRNIAAFRLKQFEFNHVDLIDDAHKLKILNELITYAIIYKNMSPYKEESYIYLRAGYYLKYKISGDIVAKNNYEENTNIALHLMSEQGRKNVLHDLKKHENDDITIEDMMLLKEHGYNRAIKQYIS